MADGGLEKRRKLPMRSCHGGAVLVLGRHSKEEEQGRSQPRMKINDAIRVRSDLGEVGKPEETDEVWPESEGIGGAGSSRMIGGYLVESGGGCIMWKRQNRAAFSYIMHGQNLNKEFVALVWVSELPREAIE